MVAPWVLRQEPPQHSKSLAQTSPFCVQNDPPTQTPLLQSFEQQSAPVVQALLEVRHPGFRGTHRPPLPQLLLQHCAEVVQAWLSVVHCDEPHTPLSQTKVQQSCGVLHEPPAALHCPGTVQILATVSQLAEQQSELLSHVTPGKRQLPDPPAPAVPALPSDPDPPAPPLPVSAEASPFVPALPPVLTSLASADPESSPADPAAPPSPPVPPLPVVVSPDEPHPTVAASKALVTTKTAFVIALFTLFTLASGGSGPAPHGRVG
jgi:hypothetical protein